ERDTLGGQKVGEPSGQRLELAKGDVGDLVWALDEHLGRASLRVLLEQRVDVGIGGRGGGSGRGPREGYFSGGGDGGQGRRGPCPSGSSSRRCGVEWTRWARSGTSSRSPRRPSPGVSIACGSARSTSTRPARSSRPRCKSPARSRPGRGGCAWVPPSRCFL